MKRESMKDEFTRQSPVGKTPSNDKRSTCNLVTATHP